MKDDGLLTIKNLTTQFSTETGKITAVDNISFQVEKGKTLGIVGESGCGKSVTSLSIMRLLPKPWGNISDGEIFFDGEDLTKLTANEMHRIRGKSISMIFQEPMTALNPVHKIEKQISEVYKLHFPDMDKKTVYKSCLEMLNKVGISAPEKRLKEYPHQLSGGMRQRVMIAIALAAKPSVLIADEPTTALDVTIQAQILDLMKSLQKESEMGIVFITHDLGVIAEMCDSVIVMYAGTIVEEASVTTLFESPHHPYTKGLLKSIPSLTDKRKTDLYTIKGMVPPLSDLPTGCRFANRCPDVMEICHSKEPETFTINKGHAARCHLYKASLDIKQSKLD